MVQYPTIVVPGGGGVTSEELSTAVAGEASVRSNADVALTASLNALSAAGATDAELAAAVSTLTTALSGKQDAATAATDAEVAAAIAVVTAAGATDAELTTAIDGVTTALALKQDAATAATDTELASAVATLNTALSGKQDASLAATDVELADAIAAVNASMATDAEVAAVAAGLQPLDSDLTTIAALSTTAYGRAFLALADAAAARATLGLGNVDNTADTAKPISMAQQTALDLKAPKRSLWLPTSAVAVTGNGRATALSGIATLTSGVLRLTSEITLPKGVPVNNIVFVAGSTAMVTPSNQWFCLVAMDLTVIRKTADDLTTAWSNNSSKGLPLSSAYTPGVDEPVYLGIVIVAATVPNIAGWSISQGAIANLSPIAAGNSTTGLTTPTTLGATAATLTASANMLWGYVT